MPRPAIEILLLNTENNSLADSSALEGISLFSQGLLKFFPRGNRDRGRVLPESRFPRGKNLRRPWARGWKVASMQPLITGTPTVMA